jgi:hypothetical protein
MIKLDTHSIQMIALCTILLSSIFLGYLEFKRLHYKLDGISNQVKVIEDLGTIKNKSNLGKLGVKDLSKLSVNKSADMPLNANAKNQDIKDPSIADSQDNYAEKAENIVNKIFGSDSPVDMDKINNVDLGENYDNLDNATLNELNNLGGDKDVNEDDDIVDDIEGDAGVEDVVDDHIDGVVDEDDVDVEVDGNDVNDVNADDLEVTDGLDFIMNTSVNNELNNKKLKELRAILKERNLSVSGNKNECINRITEDLQKTA